MSHSFHSLHCHLVFATKNREPLLGTGARGSLFAHIDAILKAEGAAMIEVNGMADHVHILTRLWPTHRLSDILPAVKSVSSGRLKRGPELAHFAWQTGYGAFSVSRSDVEAVRAYIQNQEEHHKATSLHDEFVSLCHYHRVDFDEKTMWD